VSEVRDLLGRGLAALALPCDAATLDLFMLYLAELSKWNGTHNLTAIRDDLEVVTKHFLDSALYLAAIPDDISEVADVGTGAGFPGIPVALLRPTLAVRLIEPSGKKAAFLRHAVRRLGLEGVAVHETRVETIRGLSVPLAMTRALFSAAGFVRATAGILAPGGVLVMSKGPRGEAELADLSCGHETRSLGIPGTGIVRTLVVITPGSPA
jgi:16S rRNA (guanine527-N7)-methyltransferase